MYLIPTLEMLYLLVCRHFWLVGDDGKKSFLSQKPYRCTKFSPRKILT